jgi:hypothetical protein
MPNWAESFRESGSPLTHGHLYAFGRKGLNPAKAALLARLFTSYDRL